VLRLIPVLIVIYPLSAHGQAPAQNSLFSAVPSTGADLAVAINAHRYLRAEQLAADASRADSQRGSSDHRIDSPQFRQGRSRWR
jgi:hypothetical protein